MDDFDAVTHVVPPRASPAEGSTWSDEQMCAFFGAAGVQEWYPAERPVGRQQLPSWVSGAHVDWRFGCPNPPNIYLKVHGDVRNWEGKRWEKEGDKTYIARHEDGRATVLYHSGARSLAMCWRVFIGGRPLTFQWQVPTRLPGESLEQAALREGGKNLASVKTNGDFPSPYGGPPMRGADADLVIKPFYCTTKQGGFGGDHFDLPMVDGTDTLLRGPWHGTSPPGFVEVRVCDVDQPVGRRDLRRPWHDRMVSGLLYITEDLFARILATYAPHAELARVRHSYGWQLEPYDPRWCGPKGMAYELERLRDEQHLPAGRNWRVYWDTSRNYCGAPCPVVPPHGLMEGVRS